MTSIEPGLLVLQGNRFELLCEAVWAWLGRAPLGPLEEDVFLVQNHGVAQWLKMAGAHKQGVCAAVRFELPARFLWRSFGQVLGADQMPAASPFDRRTLLWRLMVLVPQCVHQPGFELLRDFLAVLGAPGLFQLCQRLADLFDQYQVYRGDWLLRWAQGDEAFVPVDQRWQAQLWRGLLAQLTPSERAWVRPALHERFMQALAERVQVRSLARRVVVWGMSHLPGSTLQALTELAQVAQVLLVLPNPCRAHWGKGLGSDFGVSTHPLLASWGRQTADFVAQLEGLDEAGAARGHMPWPRVDLFDEGSGGTLLEQVQVAIREGWSLAEHPRADVLANDRSVVFHVAHSAQREVEVLHDQLLALLAAQPDLTARDIVVMVPDVQVFAPAITAVFGQYDAQDARFIPFDVVDLSARECQPLLRTLQALLALPGQRFTFTQVCDLLGEPSLAARFGIKAREVARLQRWLQAAGVRWGLHEAQRSAQGLQACGDQNTWAFGVRRLCLQASGSQAVQGVEPLEGVDALDPALAQGLARFMELLDGWWQRGAQLVDPGQWAVWARTLLEDFFEPQDAEQALSLSALHSALQRWLQACHAAGFAGVLTREVFTQAWMAFVDEPSLTQRFLGAGVTFCTLVPMRSIPFEVVCLLGMNEGAFPRPSARFDFDLMARPGWRRSGDRSGFEDDRQLMLDAVLSARRVFYVSWTGRSERDNSVLPPSVLVSQWRDYLAQGWSMAVVDARTVEHPLQPFGRWYFEGQGGFTYASEWQAAHVPWVPEVLQAAPSPVAPLVVDVARLTQFLKNPARDFFLHQLEVDGYGLDDLAVDEEVFALSRLDEYAWVQSVLVQADVWCALPTWALVQDQLWAKAQGWQRAGQLGLGPFGARQCEALVAMAEPMLQVWRRLRHEGVVDTQVVQLTHEGCKVCDELSTAPSRWQMLVPDVLCEGQTSVLRAPPLLGAWLRTLLWAVQGREVAGLWVGRDAQVQIPAMTQALAQTRLQAVLAALAYHQHQPWPGPSRTMLAHWQGGDEAAQKVYEDAAYGRAQVDDPCWARLYPRYSDLHRDAQGFALARAVYAGLGPWLTQEVQVVRHEVDDDLA